MFAKTAKAPSEHLCWYCLMDLHPEREASRPMWMKTRICMGMLAFDGRKKPAYERMEALTAERVLIKNLIA